MNSKMELREFAFLYLNNLKIIKKLKNKLSKSIVQQ